MTPIRQYANTLSLLLNNWLQIASVRCRLCIIIYFVFQATASGQSVIDLDAKVMLRFDGKSEAELRVEAGLIDGFTYRIPVELRVDEGVKLEDLHGKTICQCASLQFDKKSIADQKEVVTGQILLRPKSGDLAQILDAFGMRPGELEPVRIGRVKVDCKVYSPLRLVPSVVEVKDNRFPVSSIALRVSNGVEIIEAKLSDSNSAITAVFEREKNQFRLDLGDAPLPDAEGELVAEFEFIYKGKKANYVASIRYAPKAAVRVVPSKVSLRVHEDGYIGRLVVLGFGPSDTAKPTLMLEKQLSDGTWEKTNVELVIDSFGFGKTIGRFVLPNNQTIVDSEAKARMRLIDTGTNVAVAEFEIVLVK